MALSLCDWSSRTLVLWEDDSLCQLRHFLTAAILGHDDSQLRSVPDEQLQRVMSIRDSVGRTLLHEACQFGHVGFARHLLRLGREFAADVDVLNRFTPLHYAITHGHTECARLLLKAGSPVDAVAVDGVTPLILACRADMPDLVALIVRRSSGVNVRTFSQVRAALHEAAAVGSVRSVEALLASGAFVDVEEVDQITPLMLAVRFPQVVSVLIAHNANVDHHDRDGDTPLGCATMAGMTATVKLLLEAGANPRVQNYLKRSPLFISVMRDCIDCCVLLLQLNVQPDIEQRARYHNGVNKTSVELAVHLRAWKFCELFLAAGCLSESAMRIGCERTDVESFVPATQAHLWTALRQPPSLRALSRRAVRRQLPTGIAFLSAVRQLRLPASLKNSLLMNDLRCFASPQLPTFQL